MKSSQHHRYRPTAHARHVFDSFGGAQREGLCLSSRRNMMKASMAGVAGLTLPGLLQHRALANHFHFRRPRGG